jgi:multiple antibiotic resistance protein
MDNNQFSVLEQAITALMLLVDLLFIYLVLRAVESGQRALGVTGISMASRVLGLILATLSVEMILDGIRETFLPREHKRCPQRTPGASD